MIRTVTAAICLSVFVLLTGPPLIVYTLVTRSVDPIYWVGLYGVTFVTKLVGIRVHVSGLKNIPQGVCVFAANHASNADPSAIMASAPRRVAVLARKSLFNIPIMGLAFRLAHFIPVEREKREAAVGSVEEAVGHLKHGTSYLVFPEGTRSADGRLRPFKKGSFVMAIKAGAPVVPVACVGTQRIMNKKSLRIHPGQISVQFLPPIESTGYDIDERGKLAERVYKAVAEALPEDQKPVG